MQPYQEEYIVNLKSLSALTLHNRQRSQTFEEYLENLSQNQQKTEQIAQLKREIGQLRERQAEYARETADFDILKAAFGQNGVPHQIIRSVIPKLTITSNTILGQMTGGKMGVEFRLEKTERGGKETDRIGRGNVPKRSDFCGDIKNHADLSGTKRN